MATREEIDAMEEGYFRPDQSAEPAERIALALEYIANKLHGIEFNLEQIEQSAHQQANK